MLCFDRLSLEQAATIKFFHNGLKKKEMYIIADGSREVCLKELCYNKTAQFDHYQR